jgi:serine/threonine protein phosphatase PrpC
MGTYLSTPVTEKRQEAGTADNIAWGVVDMQGWRKSMEDAHVAWSQGDAASVFAVFDGHGGPEVARFCQLYLVSVLQQQPEWKLSETFKEGQVLPKETPTGRALVSSFHALDRMIDDPNRR